MYIIMSQKPNLSLASNASISYWNNCVRPAGEPLLPLSTQPGHPSYIAPPPVVQLPPPKPYVSPNPISDFFCAPSHTTPWPHNAGYKP
jgi:hypothetical protein